MQEKAIIGISRSRKVGDFLIGLLGFGLIDFIVYIGLNKLFVANGLDFFLLTSLFIVFIINMIGIFVFQKRTFLKDGILAITLIILIIVILLFLLLGSCIFSL